jgi:tetratricopeptide (TPR) repeat protein
MRSGENKIYDLLVILKALIQVWFFFSIIFLLISNKAFAGKPVEIIADGEYVMGAGETMEVAEEKAKKSAMQKAAEQAGAFVKSYTKVNNLSLEADVIEVIANHAMKVDILEKKKSVLGDVEAIKFYVKIKAILTEEDVEANLKKVREDQTIVDAYNRLKADYEKQDKEIANLKRQLELATGGDKQKIAKLISEEERKYKANLWVEKAQSLGLFADGALDAYKKALELNPELAQAYVGIAQVILSQNDGTYQSDDAESETFLKKRIKNMELSLSNLERALSIDENYADAYALRAKIMHNILNIKVYSLNETDPAVEQQYHERIVKDINRAIVLNASNKAELYNLRATVYLEKAQSAELERASSHIIEDYFNKALSDIDQAIASCKKNELECLTRYYNAKANAYSGFIYSYYIRKDKTVEANKALSSSQYWRQKAEELYKTLSKEDKEKEKIIETFQVSEYGKLEMEILNDGWRERVIGSLKDLEGKSDEEKDKNAEIKIAEIKKRISSGKASAEDYLFMAMFMFDDPVETRKDNFAKGIELFEKRAPQNREALLLVHFYHSQARFLSDNQLYDESLSGLGKAKAIVDKHLTKQKLSKKLIDLWNGLKNAEKEEEIFNTLNKLNKDEAESFFWILFSSQIISLRAEIYEKLGLYSKALEEYRYLCEQFQDEKACKDVERLK